MFYKADPFISHTKGIIPARHNKVQLQQQKIRILLFYIICGFFFQLLQTEII